jgi:hypothetical protein
MAGATGALLDGQTLAPLVKALPGQVSVHDSAQSSYKDGLYAATWIAAQCSIQDVHSVLPEHWQS